MREGEGPEEDDAADDEAHPGDLPEDRDRVYVAVSGLGFGVGANELLSEQV